MRRDVVAAICAVSAAFGATTWIVREQRAAPHGIVTQFVYDAPHRAHYGKTIHRARIRWPGGPAAIEWYDSNFEPTMVHFRAAVSLYVDGTRTATAIKGPDKGVYGDGPASLTWFAELAPGTHIIEVRLVSGGVWGIPYTDPPRPHRLVPGIDSLSVRSLGV